MAHLPEADGSGLGGSTRMSGERPFRVYDDLLPPERRAEVDEYLRLPTWEWGWRSNRKGGDIYRFWHKHYAGHRRSGVQEYGEPAGADAERHRDCAEELKKNAPLVWCLWEDLRALLLKEHTLVRCYANGLQYGSDGTVHTDSSAQGSFTSIYYPHSEWHANWAGETVFLNRAWDELIGSVYPKPGRLVVFPGTVPHVARGVSRICPVLRITLMFKTEIRQQSQQVTP